MNKWRALHNPAASGKAKHPGVVNKGLARTVRELKREQAAERNAETPHDRTRAHRTGRCECES
jgi:hypothetical protein